MTSQRRSSSAFSIFDDRRANQRPARSAGGNDSGWNSLPAVPKRIRWVRVSPSTYPKGRGCWTTAVVDAVPAGAADVAGAVAHASSRQANAIAAIEAAFG